MPSKMDKRWSGNITRVKCNVDLPMCSTGLNFMSEGSEKDLQCKVRKTGSPVENLAVQLDKYHNMSGHELAVIYSTGGRVHDN